MRTASTALCEGLPTPHTNDRKSPSRTLKQALIAMACALACAPAQADYCSLAWSANSCSGERMSAGNRIAIVSVGQITIGETGLRVEKANLSPVPEIGDYVAVSGISGVRVCGSVTFRIYDVETCGQGAVLWQEVQNVQTNGGIFNANLGAVTPITLPFDKQYWLGMQPPACGELCPRTRLTTSPYAVRAEVAETVVDGAITAEKLADGAVTPPKAPDLLAAQQPNSRIESGTGMVTSFSDLHNGYFAGLASVTFAESFSSTPHVFAVTNNICSGGNSQLWSLGVWAKDKNGFTVRIVTDGNWSCGMEFTWLAIGS